MRSALLVAMLVLGTTPATAAQWGQFGWANSNIKGGDVDVEIDVVKDGWLLMRTDHRLKSVPGGGLQPFDVKRWADSRKCVTVTDRMQALGKVAWPSIDLPRPNTETRFMLDGSTAYLDAPVMFGADGVSGSRVHLENYDEGPVFTWVTDTLRFLEPCWSETKPDA